MSLRTPDGKLVQKMYVGADQIVKAYSDGRVVFSSVADTFAMSRTLDRTFGDTPASGGGNVDPQTFTYQEQDWELWQVIPFLGSGVGPPGVGDCRVQLRNRSIGRGQMELADMPARVILTSEGGQTADWPGLPWAFTRPTAGNKYTSPGSGQSARRAIDYEPARTIGSATPASLGINQGETFTITLVF